MRIGEMEEAADGSIIIGIAINQPLEMETALASVCLAPLYCI
jgi:hypothetical protein